MGRWVDAVHLGSAAFAGVVVAGVVEGPAGDAVVWKTATAWRGEAADVDRAARVMATEVRQRHGVDVDQLAEQQQAVRLAEVRAAAKGRSDYDLARDWLARTAPDQLREHDREYLGTERAAGGDTAREELVARWREKAGARPSPTDSVGPASPTMRRRPGWSPVTPEAFRKPLHSRARPRAARRAPLAPLHGSRISPCPADPR